MNAKSLFALLGCLLGLFSEARGDGFIIVERPIFVPPGHYPFAPLEVIPKAST